MPRIGLGNAINSLNAFRDEFISPFPYIRARRYLAYAKIPTDVAANTIPLLIPSRAKDVPDKPLVIGNLEQVYSIQAVLNCPCVVGANNRLKVAGAVNNANAWLVSGSIVSGKADAGLYGGSTGTPGGTLNAPLGNASNLGLTPLRLFITDTGGTALGTGIITDPNAATAVQREIYAKYNDKANLLVSICTFEPFVLTGNFTSLANADQTFIPAFEEVFKGI